MRTALVTFHTITLLSIAGLATAPAKTETLFYPSQDAALFSIEAPADWEVTAIDEVGDYGTLESENGSTLQFRAVAFKTEAEAAEEVKSIAKLTMEYLDDNFTDIELEKAKDVVIAGCPGFQVAGTAKDQDGVPLQILTATIVLGPTSVAEIWAAAYEDDVPVAQAVVRSFRPAGGSAAAPAETAKLFYPSQDAALFSIEAPSDWEATAGDEVGDYGTLESENGSYLQFRAVEFETEAEAAEEVDSIAKLLTEYLMENYTDIKLEKPQEVVIAGCPGAQLVGTAKDQDGVTMQVLSATVALGPTSVAEIWAATYEDDVPVAQAVLQSFMPAASGPAR